MRRIAVMNQKGGVGKTTTAANLAAAAALAGRRVLMVDLDPQAHLSLHFGTDVGPDDPSVLDVLIDHRPVTEVLVEARANLTLLPAHTYLATAETALAHIPERELILRRALEPIMDRYDVLIIDCPPSLGVLTISALTIADEVLIPMQTHFFALQGLSKLLETVSLVRERVHPELRVGGVVLCMHEPNTKLAGEVVEDLFKFFDSATGTDAPWAGAKVYRNFIRRNIKLAEACSFGQTVFDYAPRSNGAVDYEELAKEVFNLDEAVQAPEPPKAAASGAGKKPSKAGIHAASKEPLARTA